jgi:N,N'-diacetyllegionaminate synthase
VGIEIIAEIGVNHEGKLDQAFALITTAKQCGCHTAKFQLWNTEEVYPRERWDEMKALELSRDDIEQCRDFCLETGIRFLCTPDTINDAWFLKEIGVERIKIGSSNITNQNMLQHVALFGLPVLLSTGACDFCEMTDAVDIFKWRAPLTIMHCVSAYPAPVGELNLRVMRSFFNHFRMADLGFSDHSPPTAGHTDAALIALAFNARVFERHLTLDKSGLGPDHRASLSPEQMKEYVAALLRGFSMLGDNDKRVMPCEERSRAENLAFVARQYEREANVNAHGSQAPT